jgi:hypothetical protein
MSLVILCGEAQGPLRETLRRFEIFQPCASRMNKFALVLFVTSGLISMELLGNGPRGPSLYLQGGANYGLPAGQRHFPVIVSNGPNPILPVIQGGFDLRPILSYTLQSGIAAPLSRSGIHGVRLGLGLTRRGLRFEYFDHAVEWGGSTFILDMDEVHLSFTDFEFASTYSFAKGRLGVDAGLLGIVWRKKVYTDRSTSGFESRVASPRFIRLREWYPTIAIAYKIASLANLDISMYGCLSRRGFNKDPNTWWDGQLGFRIACPWRRK